MTMVNKRGFTLTELLITVAILAILVTIALGAVRGNRQKADDARVKSELNRLKIAFEDYYTDHNCYPPATYFDDAEDCGSDELKPYLNSLSCDPNTGLPYHLVTDDTGCEWYTLYAVLKDPSNFTIPPTTIEDTTYQYSVSSSNVANSTNPKALPPGHTYYYCSSISNCTTFNHLTQTCTPYYTDNPNCDGGASPCQSIGTCIHL